MPNKTCVVQILSAEVERIYDRSNAVPAYDFTVQQGWISSAAPFPTQLSVTLPKGAAPYAPGIYLLGGGCVVPKAVSGAAGKARIGYAFETGVELVPLADALAELTKLDKDGRAAAAPAVARAS